MPSRTTILAVFTLMLAAVLGYMISRDDVQPPSVDPVVKEPTLKQVVMPPNKSLKRSETRRANDFDQEKLPLFALAQERIAVFKSDEAYRKFLASLGQRKFKLLGKSDRLRAVRFGFSRGTSTDGIDDAELAYNYSVNIPSPPDASAQVGASGFGRDALSWLGVTGDNSQWGKGVTVAVLDSGVNSHIALNQQNGKVSQIALTEVTDSSQLGHGTAVASIISGDHQLTPGVAPASDILSIRITDDSGSSDSFTLADGIIQAVDAGADVINISMGSYGDSHVVKSAVEYAQKNGSVIVASSGNAGLSAIAYPAAYEGVIAVGAVEAKGEHLEFSNTGENLGISAPGYAVNAAWGEEQLTQFSGTSASAPFISGAIAATMSEKNLTAAQATELVLGNSNEAGLPGSDDAYGAGILDLGRIMNDGTAGIYDVALASQVLVPPSATSTLPQVLVTVQNRGTETLINSPLTINSPSGTQTINISSLAPGAIQTYPVPVLLNNPVTVSSSVQTTESDINATNNNRSDDFSE
ncbi:MAG: S8 family serine peptidase [Akkermansiaceae bacterium]